MYQQSVDRSHGSSKSDLILLIGLIVAFFAIGAVVFVLESNLGSKLPRYIFIALALIALYLIYRLRLVGYRYTVFFKEPEPVYDPRFDDMMLHEDYPYPVGTVVFERIVSAKGSVLLTVDKSNIVALTAPNCAPPAGEVSRTVDFSCTKRDKAYSLYFNYEGGLARVLFAPDDEFLVGLETIMNS